MSNANNSSVPATESDKTNTVLYANNALDKGKPGFEFETIFAHEKDFSRIDSKENTSSQKGVQRNAG